MFLIPFYNKVDPLLTNMRLTSLAFEILSSLKCPIQRCFAL